MYHTSANLRLVWPRRNSGWKKMRQKGNLKTIGERPENAAQTGRDGASPSHLFSWHPELEAENRKVYLRSPPCFFSTLPLDVQVNEEEEEEEEEEGRKISHLFSGFSWENGLQQQQLEAFFWLSLSLLPFQSAQVKDKNTRAKVDRSLTHTHAGQKRIDLFSSQPESLPVISELPGQRKEWKFHLGKEIKTKRKNLLCVCFFSFFWEKNLLVGGLCILLCDDNLSWKQEINNSLDIIIIFL